MALPKQVQTSIDEIEELEKQMKAPVDTDAETAEVEDGQTTEAEEELVEDTEVVAEVDEETPTQTNEPEAAEVDWEHKYHRLQGKYDAEVPRLHQQLRDLSERIEAMQEQKPQATKEEETVVEKLVTDADIDEYGQEFIDLQRRIAKEAIQGDLAELRKENAKLRAELDQTGSQVGEVSFEARLHRLVPDFVDLNNDPGWVEWLDTVDPIIRAPRRAIAQDAFNRGDAEAVAHYVSLYRGDAGVEAVKPDRSAEVKRQVQPSKTAASTAPSSRKGQTYTNADIEGMFNKVMMYTNRQQFDEARKLEAEIDAAFKEGRVTA